MSETPSARIASSHLVEGGDVYCSNDEDDVAPGPARRSDAEIDARAERDRERSWAGAFIVGAVLFTVGALPFTARADDPTPTDVALPSAGEVVALDQGDRAPHAGMLVLDEDLFSLQAGLAGARLRLAADAQLAAQVLDARLAQERARTTAAQERVQLHDGLWQDRQRELLVELAAARRRAERGWWESPPLWLVVGLVLGVVGVAVVGAVI